MADATVCNLYREVSVAKNPTMANGQTERDRNVHKQNSYVEEIEKYIT